MVGEGLSTDVISAKPGIEGGNATLPSSTDIDNSTGQISANSPVVIAALVGASIVVVVVFMRKSGS